MEGNIIPWHGIPVFPGLAQTYGNETILDHAKLYFGGDLRAGLVMTLMDVWVLDPMVWRQLNVASWVPVDHQPVPEPIVRFFRDSGAVPIAMSRFGQAELREKGLDPLYCPHAVDCEVFTPEPQAEARKKTHLPEGFIVGMVAANKGNPSRKCFVESFQAFKVLQDRHEDARLYLHTELTGKFEGVNLPNVLQEVGIDLETVIFCDQYRAIHRPFDQETMARIYNSLDVLLAPSSGEGFGIPVVEAGACGVPSIVSDFSAQPEVLGAGWKVGGRRIYTPIGAWQVLPNVEEIAESLEEAYNTPRAERRRMAKLARDHAETYDLKRVLHEHMLPAIEEAAQRFEDRKPVELVAA